MGVDVDIGVGVDQNLGRKCNDEFPGWRERERMAKRYWLLRTKVTENRHK